MDILTWRIEDQHCAIDLAAVDFVFLAAETTTLPNVPHYLLGAINIHGQIVPVINTRELLGLPKKEVEASDYFILVRVHHTSAILWVDQVKLVRVCSEQELLSAQEAFPEMPAVEHFLKENGQMILFYNLEKLIPSTSLLGL